MGWATFWAIFSTKTHLVALFPPFSVASNDEARRDIFHLSARVEVLVITVAFTYTRGPMLWIFNAFAEN
jgi:hypothetical protein